MAELIRTCLVDRKLDRITDVVDGDRDLHRRRGGRHDAPTSARVAEVYVPRDLAELRAVVEAR